MSGTAISIICLLYVLGAVNMAMTTLAMCEHEDPRVKTLMKKTVSEDPFILTLFCHLLWPVFVILSIKSMWRGK